MTARYELVGSLQVPLPPAEAFRLFTARGEEDWVAGWQPRFPVSTEDDTEPGTVFETDAHGDRTTWVVTERDRPHRIAYARVTPGARAGLVTVLLAEADNGSEVTVRYDLTPLGPAVTPQLEEFAANYPAFLQSWQDAIEEWLRRP